jgi:hypothetical protein
MYRAELESLHTLPPWLATVNATIVHVLRSTTLYNVPATTGSFFAWPALTLDLLRLDMIRVAGRCTVITGMLMNDYLWHWRRAAALAERETHAHWTSRWWASFRAAVAPVIVSTASRPMTWDGFLPSVVEQLGILSVGSAAMASLLAASGSTYSWATANSLVIHCALRGDQFPIDMLRATMQDGSTLRDTWHPTVYQDDEVGAAVGLLKALGGGVKLAQAIVRVARDHRLLAHWVTHIMAAHVDHVLPSSEKAPSSEKEEDASDPGMSLDAMTAIWLAAKPPPFEERRDEAIVTRLAERIPLALVYNGWHLLYILRQSSGMA